MKKMVRLVSIGPVCVVLASAAFAQQTTPATDRLTVPFSDPDRPGTLKVTLLEGSVSIKGTNRRDVLFVTNSQGARDALRRRQQAEPPPGMRRLSQPAGFGVQERDNEMSVSSSFDRHVDLEIEVPMRTRLQMSAVNGGGITVDGVDSEIEINTVSGGITLTGVAGSVVAHAVNGRIAATIARAAPQAPMAFTSLNGDIDVTLPPSVKANLRVRSDQGDVFTDFDVQLTASADASRTQRNGRAVRIDVNRSISGTINGGGPDFELRTFNGNIYVRKGK
jgi:putative adhesin